MKIYTRTGDDGTTALFGGGRVSKTHLRVVAYGTVDELNASLGLARSECARIEMQAAREDAARGDQPAESSASSTTTTGSEPPTLVELDSALGEVQSMLFEIGAILATPPDASAAAASRTNTVEDDDILKIEQAIDRFSDALPPLQSFVLPGGSELASRLHVARTICRRAEREMVTLMESEFGKKSGDAAGGDEPASSASTTIRHALTWLNRLSDLLFVLARFANHAQRVDDVPWHARTRPV